MNGRTKWDELQHKATPDQLDRARGELEHAISLAELRRAREMTQVQLASALEVTQPGVSRMERQTDLYVSTLRSYVEALGGTLDIRALFADGEILIDTFGAVDEDIAPVGRA